MKVSDLKTGMICTLRNGTEYIVLRDFATFPSETINLVRCDQVLWNTDGILSLSYYNDDLEYVSLRSRYEKYDYEREQEDRSLDIMEVYLRIDFIEFYHKQDGRGKILWHRDESSITANDPQADQLPRIYYAPGGYVNPKTPVEPRSAHAVLVFLRRYYAENEMPASLEKICEGVDVDVSSAHQYIEKLTNAGLVSKSGMYKDAYWPVHWLRNLPLESE